MYECINDTNYVVASSFPLVSEVASACLLLVSLNIRSTRDPSTQVFVLSLLGSYSTY